MVCCYHQGWIFSPLHSGHSNAFLSVAPFAIHCERFQGCLQASPWTRTCIGSCFSLQVLQCRSSIVPSGYTSAHARLFRTATQSGQNLLTLEVLHGRRTKVGWRIGATVLVAHFSVPLNFSESPLHIGWYGVVFSCLILSKRATSFMQFDTNWVPRSLRISSGTPRQQNMLTNVSATVSVSMFLGGTASG